MRSARVPKPFLIVVVATLLSTTAGARAGPPCMVEVKDDVEVAGPAVSLAHLLTSDACPQLWQVASRVRLGRTPLPGSVRVLEGVEIRRMIDAIAESSGKQLLVRVPERVSVRRAGGRASCYDLTQRLAFEASTCGAAGRIPLAASLEFGGTFWDASLRRWEVVARCAHPGDCVPFLVVPRVPSPGADPTLGRTTADGPSMPVSPVVRKPLVQPGQTATLEWDANGIRMTLRATSLDRGALGEKVRARVAPGRRILRAVVVGPGFLRTTP